MTINSSIWKSWAEISNITKNKEIILYGRSEDWLPKTLKKIKNVNYIVDGNKIYNNTKYLDIEVFLPEKLFDKTNNQDKYIIITSSLYFQIADTLIENGYVPGHDFCCCPEFKDYSDLENIKNLDKNILVSSSDYLEKSRARSSANGGGIYEYNLLECEYELKIPGVYRQVDRLGNNFIGVEYVRGELHVFDKNYNIVHCHNLDAANYCGIACTDKLISIVNAASDSVTLLSSKDFSLLDKIHYADSKDTSSNHHLNDCCVNENKLYVTMFSNTGRWKNGIFDGALVEYDLDNLSQGPLVLTDTAWMPHSPEFIDDEICYLDSMRGNLMTCNQYPTAHFDYFARGLDGDGRYYIVGASENMYTSRIKDSGGKQTIMVNAGFSIFDRETNMRRFHPFMHNMNIHDVIFL